MEVVINCKSESSQKCCLHLVAGHLLLGLKSLGLCSSQFVSDFFLASYKKSQWPIGTMLLSLKKNSSLPTGTVDVELESRARVSEAVGTQNLRNTKFKPHSEVCVSAESALAQP